MRHLWRALSYLRPYRGLAAGSVVIIILSGLAALLAPWPLKIVIDNVLNSAPLDPWLVHVFPFLPTGRTALLWVAVLLSLGAALLVNALAVLENYLNTKINLGISLDYRADLFEHAQKLSMSYHDQRRSGLLIYMIGYQCDAASGLIMAVPPLAQNLITLAGMFWVMVLIDPQLAVVSMTVVPFLYYSVGYYVKRIQPQLMAVKGMEAETLGIIHEALSMVRVIVAFGREKYELQRYRTQGERALDARVKLTVRQTIFSLVVNMTTATGTAVILGFGAYRAMQGRLRPGDLYIVMSYVLAVYRPLEVISTTIGSLQDQFVNLKVTMGLLDTDPEIKDVRGALPLQRAWGRVTFKGVRFGYAGREGTLKDISLDIPAGKTVAIVGPTGAGKTTLISLLPRFYQPSSGKILLDGVDVRKIALRSLRQQIALVQQEPLLFSDTIASNIRYGRLDADMDAVIAAAKAANAHDFITALPDGYETIIGERGAKLSGGERQRVAVARAFLKDAPILILDEPTSSIDSKTEAVILDALDRLMVGRTTFMVAHRLSTVRNADVILVMNHGRVVEQGTHAELLQQNGLYRQLYEMQTKVRQPA
jgi:ABC-type multidrug transport system fused ATPase/permease subunit